MAFAITPRSLDTQDANAPRLKPDPSGPAEDHFIYLQDQTIGQRHGASHIPSHVPATIAGQSGLL